MGYLESRIIKYGNFQTLPHLTFDLPKSNIVLIRQDGSPVPLKVNASSPVEIAVEELSEAAED